MDGHPAAPAWTYLIPLVAVGLVMLRNSRERRLKVEQLWIAPLVILALTGLVLAQQSLPAAPLLALYALALAAGALAGWWRGRLTRITVDPQTHALTSRTSPLGMLLILGLFAVRYALRSASGVTAGALHVAGLQITDLLMLLAVGIVCAQRLEMAIRAKRLLDEARARAEVMRSDFG
jgi:hypothetical protein